MLAVKEKSLDVTTSSFCREFGVCFVDTTIGVFRIGQFQDDSFCSRLCTLLAHYPPAQVGLGVSAICVVIVSIIMHKSCTSKVISSDKNTALRSLCQGSEVYLFCVVCFQVLFERGKSSQDFKKILSTGLSSCLQTALSPVTEFWDDSHTLKVLSDQK